MSAFSIVLTWGKRDNCLEQDLDWDLVRVPEWEEKAWEEKAGMVPEELAGMGWDWELDWVQEMAQDQGSTPNILPGHSSIWMGRKNRRGSRSVVVLRTSNMCYL